MNTTATISSLALLVGAVSLAGCSSGPDSSPEPPAARIAQAVTTPKTKIEHVVIVVMENHTFDHYFGDWCTNNGFNNCDRGWGCCETAFTNTSTWRAAKQSSVPVTQANDVYNQSVGSLDNGANQNLTAMNRMGTPPFIGTNLTGFGMNNFTVPPTSFAYLSAFQTIPYNGGSSALTKIFDLAKSGALADRYFAPIVGASSANTMFFATAGFMFQDNQATPMLGGCGGNTKYNYSGTLGNLMDAKSLYWANYYQGYGAGCAYDPSDNPYAYFTFDNATSVANDSNHHTKAYEQFGKDVLFNSLPAVAIVKPSTGNSGHQGHTLTAGETFVKGVYDTLFVSSPVTSPIRSNTLLVVTWDEGGGFYDHVPPPTKLADATLLPQSNVGSQIGGASSVLANPASTINATCTADWHSRVCGSGDNECFLCDLQSASQGQQYYGARVPLLALGPFARQYPGAGYISHVTMEHSSIVKFIEWNWSLGSLGRRDDHVNNLGSMLTPDLGVIGGTTRVPEGVHALCEQGAALARSDNGAGDTGRGNGSTPKAGGAGGGGAFTGSGCVDMICGTPAAPVDIYCCETWWDATCVNEVSSKCSLSCPGW